MIKLFTFFTLLVLGSATVFSQEVIKQQPCENVSIRAQADSLKLIYVKKGFKVMKESSVSMESEFEVPIIVQLRERSLYHFIFISDKTSRLFEVKMYDWEEKKIFSDKRKYEDGDGNISQWDHIPLTTNYHMIKPVQVNKKNKKMCGYFIVLKKVR